MLSNTKTLVLVCFFDCTRLWVTQNEASNDFRSFERLFWISLIVISLVRGRRQAHNPTLAKILRLTYNRSCSHNRPQTAACNAVYSISRRALLITRLGEQLPRPRQVSMALIALWVVVKLLNDSRFLWDAGSYSLRECKILCKKSAKKNSL